MQANSNVEPRTRRRPSTGTGCDRNIESPRTGESRIALIVTGSLQQAGIDAVITPLAIPGAGSLNGLPAVRAADKAWIVTVSKPAIGHALRQFGRECGVVIIQVTRALLRKIRENPENWRGIIAVAQVLQAGLKAKLRSVKDGRRTQRPVKPRPAKSTRTATRQPSATLQASRLGTERDRTTH